MMASQASEMRFLRRIEGVTLFNKALKFEHFNISEHRATSPNRKVSA